MAAASGQYGKIMVGGSTLVECTEWSLQEQVAEHVYASCATSGWKKRVAGTKDVSGTCGGIYDPTAPIHDYINIGDSVTLKLYLSTLAYHQVPAIVLSIETNLNIEEGEIIRWTMNWGGNGQPTFDLP